MSQIANAPFPEVDLLNATTARGKEFYVGVSLVFKKDGSDFNRIALFYGQSRFHKGYPLRQ
jgi:hypothetical protein